MAVARRSEGPCAPLFFAAARVVVLAALLGPVSAMSQTVEVATLEQCIAMETEELKLRCFEAIIAGNEAGDDEMPATQEPPADNPAPAPAPAAVAPAAAATVNDATDVVPQAEQAFGQEHLARQEEDQPTDDALLQATVIEVSRGRNDILYFHLDNDQVWRQIEARHFSYPKSSEFDVNITRGMMGDYRMRIGDNGRMVRIRRVK